MSVFKLNPGNIETSRTVIQTVTDRARSLTSSAARSTVALAGNQLFGKTVHPRLVKHMQNVMQRRDENDVIIIYKQTADSIKTVYWPPHTRPWSLDDSDASPGGTMKSLGGDRRNVPKRIEPGGPIPAWLDLVHSAAAGALAPRLAPYQSSQVLHRATRMKAVMP